MLVLYLYLLLIPGSFTLIPEGCFFGSEFQGIPTFNGLFHECDLEKIKCYEDCQKSKFQCDPWYRLCTSMTCSKENLNECFHIAKVAQAVTSHPFTSRGCFNATHICENNNEIPTETRRSLPCDSDTFNDELKHVSSQFSLLQMLFATHNETFDCTLSEVTICKELSCMGSKRDICLTTDYENWNFILQEEENEFEVALECLNNWLGNEVDISYLQEFGDLNVTFKSVNISILNDPSTGDITIKKYDLVFGVKSSEFGIINALEITVNDVGGFNGLAQLQTNLEVMEFKFESTELNGDFNITALVNISISNVLQAFTFVNNVDAFSEVQEFIEDLTVSQISIQLKDFSPTFFDIVITKVSDWNVLDLNFLVLKNLEIYANVENPLKNTNDTVIVTGGGFVEIDGFEFFMNIQLPSPPFINLQLPHIDYELPSISFKSLPFFSLLLQFIPNFQIDFSGMNLQIQDLAYNFNMDLNTFAVNISCPIVTFDVSTEILSLSFHDFNMNYAENEFFISSHVSGFIHKPFNMEIQEALLSMSNEYFSITFVIDDLLSVFSDIQEFNFMSSMDKINGTVEIIEFINGTRLLRVVFEDEQILSFSIVENLLSSIGNIDSSSLSGLFKDVNVLLSECAFTFDITDSKMELASLKSNIVIIGDIYIGNDFAVISNMSMLLSYEKLLMKEQLTAFGTISIGSMTHEVDIAFHGFTIMEISFPNLNDANLDINVLLGNFGELQHIFGDLQVLGLPVDFAFQLDRIIIEIDMDVLIGYTISLGGIPFISQLPIIDLSFSSIIQFTWSRFDLMFSNSSQWKIEFEASGSFTHPKEYHFPNGIITITPSSMEVKVKSVDLIQRIGQINLFSITPNFYDNIHEELGINGGEIRLLKFHNSNEYYFYVEVLTNKSMSISNILVVNPYLPFNTLDMLGTVVQAGEFILKRGVGSFSYNSIYGGRMKKLLSVFSSSYVLLDCQGIEFVLKNVDFTSNMLCDNGECHLDNSFVGLWELNYKGMPISIPFDLIIPNIDAYDVGDLIVNLYPVSFGFNYLKYFLPDLEWIVPKIASIFPLPLMEFNDFTISLFRIALNTGVFDMSVKFDYPSLQIVNLIGSGIVDVIISFQSLYFNYGRVNGAINWNVTSTTSVEINIHILDSDNTYYLDTTTMTVGTNGFAISGRMDSIMDVIYQIFPDASSLVLNAIDVRNGKYLFSKNEAGEILEIFGIFTLTSEGIFSIFHSLGDIESDISLFITKDYVNLIMSLPLSISLDTVKNGPFMKLSNIEIQLQHTELQTSIKFAGDIRIGGSFGIFSFDEECTLIGGIILPSLNAILGGLTKYPYRPFPSSKLVIEKNSYVEVELGSACGYQCINGFSIVGSAQINGKLVEIVAVSKTGDLSVYFQPQDNLFVDDIAAIIGIDLPSLGLTNPLVIRTFGISKMEKILHVPNRGPFHFKKGINVDGTIDAMGLTFDIEIRSENVFDFAFQMSLDSDSLDKILAEIRMVFEYFFGPFAGCLHPKVTMNAEISYNLFKGLEAFVYVNVEILGKKMTFTIAVNLGWNYADLKKSILNVLDIPNILSDYCKMDSICVVQDLDICEPPSLPPCPSFTGMSPCKVPHVVAGRYVNVVVAYTKTFSDFWGSYVKTLYKNVLKWIAPYTIWVDSICENTFSSIEGACLRARREVENAFDRIPNVPMCWIDVDLKQCFGKRRAAEIGFEMNLQDDNERRDINGIGDCACKGKGVCVNGICNCFKGYSFNGNECIRQSQCSSANCHVKSSCSEQSYGYSCSPCSNTPGDGICCNNRCPSHLQIRTVEIIVETPSLFVGEVVFLSAFTDQKNTAKYLWSNGAKSHTTRALFYKPGTYEVGVHVFNDVHYYTKTISLQIAEFPIQELTITLPLIGKKGTSIFEVVTSGTNVESTIRINGTIIRENFVEQFVSYDFQNAGKYLVEIFARNSVSEKTITKNIEILEDMGELTISTNAPNLNAISCALYVFEASLAEERYVQYKWMVTNGNETLFEMESGILGRKKFEFYNFQIGENVVHINASNGAETLSMNVTVHITSRKETYCHMKDAESIFELTDPERFVNFFINTVDANYVHENSHRGGIENVGWNMNIGKLSPLFDVQWKHDCDEIQCLRVGKKDVECSIYTFMKSYYSLEKDFDSFFYLEISSILESILKSSIECPSFFDNFLVSVLLSLSNFEKNEKKSLSEMTIQAFEIDDISFNNLNVRLLEKLGLLEYTTNATVVYDFVYSNVIRNLKCHPFCTELIYKNMAKVVHGMVRSMLQQSEESESICTFWNEEPSWTFTKKSYYGTSTLRNMCNLNGIEVNGRCVCNVGFYGNKCDMKGYVTRNMDQNDANYGMTKTSFLVEDETGKYVPKFSPDFFLTKDIKNDRFGGCGLFRSPISGHCSKYENESTCVLNTNCHWNAYDRCLHDVVQGCSNVKTHTEVLSHPYQIIISPFIGKLTLTNEEIIISGWYQWSGYKLIISREFISVNDWNIDRETHEMYVFEGDVIGRVNKVWDVINSFRPDNYVEFTLLYDDTPIDPMPFMRDCAEGCTFEVFNNGITDAQCNKERCGYEGRFQNIMKSLQIPSVFEDRLSMHTKFILYKILGNDLRSIIMANPSVLEFAKGWVNKMKKGGSFYMKEKYFRVFTNDMNDNEKVSSLYYTLLEGGVNDLSHVFSDPKRIGFVEISKDHNMINVNEARVRLHEYSIMGMLQFSEFNNTFVVSILQYNYEKGNVSIQPPLAQNFEECSVEVCSFQGSCDINGKCKCDENYSGSFCFNTECPNNCGRKGICLKEEIYHDLECYCHPHRKGFDCAEWRKCNDDPQSQCYTHWMNDKSTCDLQCYNSPCGDLDCNVDCPCKKGTALWNLLDNIYCGSPCDVPACHNKTNVCSQEEKECSPGCFVAYLGDKICNPKCDNPACNYDSKNGQFDCGPIPSKPCDPITCPMEVRGISCPEGCNTEECRYGWGICERESECPCSIEQMSVGECILACNISACNFSNGNPNCIKEEYCSKGCPISFTLNDDCNPMCNVEACGYDKGKCRFSDEEEVQCAPECTNEILNSDLCYEECDNSQCQYSGGSCLVNPFCHVKSISNGMCDMNCLIDGGNDGGDCDCSPGCFRNLLGVCECPNDKICAVGCDLSIMGDSTWCYPACNVLECLYPENGCGPCNFLECGLHSKCIEEEGTIASCNCNEHYEKDDNEVCTDLCTLGRPKCDKNNTECYLTNSTIVPYECKCIDDYTELNDECIYIDPCLLNPCPIHNICERIDDTNRTCSCETPEWILDEIGICRHKNSDECFENNGKITCQCKMNYIGDGIIHGCHITDVCSRCPPKSKCKRGNDGNLFCSCDVGFIMAHNDTKCVDHCYDNPCLDMYERCESLLDSYICESIPGYYPNGSDINECEVLKGSACAPLAECKNLIGTYNCSCPPGFRGDGFPKSGICEGYVVETDEEGNNITVIKEFECVTLGKSGSGCVDINECEENLHNCEENAVCVNMQGSFRCECPLGWFGNGTTTSPCINQFDGNCIYPGWKKEGNICVEVDLCTGNWEFTENVTEGIMFIDNCTETGQCKPFHNCSLEISTCQHYRGGFWCECHEGYTHTDPHRLICEDINECQEGLHNCGEHATCINLPGSFSCICDEGYVGDGIFCVDHNECGNEPCPSNSTCFNTEGGFYCECIEGYVWGDLKQTFCKEKIHCNYPSEIDCPSNSSCVNIPYPGTYACECFEGFSMFNSSCELKDLCNQKENICDPFTTVCEIKMLNESGLTKAGVICECARGWNDNKYDISSGNYTCSSCDSNVLCSSRGVCSLHGCDCFNGFSNAIDCSVIDDDCDDLACTNHGNCQMEGNICNCIGGWDISTDCSICNAEVLCLSHGTCNSLDFNGTCECFYGYAGSSCEFECPGKSENEFCSGHGICNGESKCICDEGWWGNDCSVCCLSYDECLDINMPYYCALNYHHKSVCHIIDDDIIPECTCWNTFYTSSNSNEPKCVNKCLNKSRSDYPCDSVRESCTVINENEFECSCKYPYVHSPSHENCQIHNPCEDNIDLCLDENSYCEPTFDVSLPLKLFDCPCIENFERDIFGGTCNNKWCLNEKDDCFHIDNFQTCFEKNQSYDCKCPNDWFGDDDGQCCCNSLSSYGYEIDAITGECECLCHDTHEHFDGEPKSLCFSNETCEIDNDCPFDFSSCNDTNGNCECDELFQRKYDSVMDEYYCELLPLCEFNSFRGESCDKETMDCYSYLKNFNTPMMECNCKGNLIEINTGSSHRMCSCNNIETCKMGLCMSSNIDDCECFEGYEGDQCEVPTNDCRSLLCNDKGNCSTEYYGLCICDNPLFRGVDCSDCSFLCHGEAICNVETNFICECPYGYYGKDCEYHCKGEIGIGIFCNGNGACLGNSTYKNCECEPGYFGDECNRCNGNALSIFNGTCQCKPGYHGMDCEFCSGNSESVPLSTVVALVEGNYRKIVNCNCSNGFLSSNYPMNQCDECNGFGVTYSATNGCTCKDGYLPNGKFEFACQYCLGNAKDQMHISSGGENLGCVCKDAYFGNDCELKCPSFNNSVCGNGACKYVNNNFEYENDDDMIYVWEPIRRSMIYAKVSSDLKESYGIPSGQVSEEMSCNQNNIGNIAYQYVNDFEYEESLILNTPICPLNKITGEYQCHEDIFKDEYQYDDFEGFQCTSSDVKCGLYELQCVKRDSKICDCEEGWYGNSCSECSGNGKGDPQNVLADNVNCDCKSGWYGSDCNRCNGKGTGYSGEEEEGICSCVNGWRGNDCEECDCANNDCIILSNENCDTCAYSYYPPNNGCFSCKHGWELDNSGFCNTCVPIWINVQRINVVCQNIHIHFSGGRYMSSICMRFTICYDVVSTVQQQSLSHCQ